MSRQPPAAETAAHVEDCWLCEEVLTQICGHSAPPGGAAPAELFTAGQLAALARVQELLNEAHRVLGDDSVADHPECGSLRTLVNRVRHAAMHVRNLGWLSDSDVSMAGLLPPPRRRNVRLPALPPPPAPPPFDRIDYSAARPPYYAKCGD